MSYSTQKLKDISIIKTGKLDSNAAVENGVYPFFTCDPQTLRINKWAYNTEAVLLAGNNASGNYTAKYYCGKFNAYQRTYIIETADNRHLSVRFLCYAINQQLRLLKTMSSGSTTKFLTIRMLHNLDIPCPEIEVQDRIVNTLGTIDDLIENNQKQIKLLEEAAQRLYKEWFVDLRFPGYEHTKIVNGIPEGWKKEKLVNVSSVLRRGISPVYDDQGKYTVINQKCIRQNIMDIHEARRQTKDYSSELNITDGDTLICSTGSGTLGRVGQVFGNFMNTTIDSHVTLVRPQRFVNIIYHAIKNQENHLMSMGRGSTNQQELYRSVIEELNIFISEKSVWTYFENIFKNIHMKITNINKQNYVLIEARDRLLPKLMSGEIEV